MKPKPTKPNPAPVSPEEFVRVWQSSATLSEVAKKLGRSIGCIASRATHYRKHGIRLKRFRAARSPLDVAALNKIIDNGQPPPDQGDSEE